MSRKPTDDERAFLAQLQNPENHRTGCLIAGAPGMGKTTLYKLILIGALARTLPMILVDLAGELAQFVQEKRLSPHYPIYTVNAHQVGGTRIDWAALINRNSDILAFANHLVPATKGDPQPAFRENAAALFGAAIEVLNYWSPKNWVLADVLRLLLNYPLLASITKVTPGVVDPIAHYGPEAQMNMYGGVVGRCAKLRIYAALEEQATQTVNPLDVIAKGGCLILERADRFSEVCEAMYAMVFDTVGMHILSRQSDQLVLFGFDEVRSLGKLNCLLPIALRGRKSGIATCMSVHEVSGFFDRYGKEEGSEILALQQSKYIFRCASPETAKWFAEFMGNPEVLETVINHSWSGSGRSGITGGLADFCDGMNGKSAPGGGNTTSEVRRVIEKLNVVPDRIRRLPRPDVKGDRLEGFFDTPEDFGAFSVPFLEQTSHKTPRRREEVPGDYEKLKLMDLKRLQELKIPTFPAIVQHLKT